MAGQVPCMKCFEPRKLICTRCLQLVQAGFAKDGGKKSHCDKSLSLDVAVQEVAFFHCQQPRYFPPQGFVDAFALPPEQGFYHQLPMMRATYFNGEMIYGTPMHPSFYAQCRAPGLQYDSDGASSGGCTSLDSSISSTGAKSAAEFSASDDSASINSASSDEDGEESEKDDATSPRQVGDGPKVKDKRDQEVQEDDCNGDDVVNGEVIRMPNNATMLLKKILMLA